MKAAKTVVIRMLFPGEFEVVHNGRTTACHDRGELRQKLNLIFGDMPVTEEEVLALREAQESENADV